jgi:hypothetical protein
MISLIALGVAGPARHHLIDRRLVFFILVTSPASQTKARFCKDIPVGHPTDMDETPAMRTGTIRKLLTTEESLFRNHLLRLDAAGRRDRFMGGVADEFLVRYATECFASKSLVLGFFEQDNLRAAGELHLPKPLVHSPDQPVMSLVGVDQDHQIVSEPRRFDVRYRIQCRTGIPKSRNRHGHAEAVDPFSAESKDSTFADELSRAKSGDAGACAQIQG